MKKIFYLLLFPAMLSAQSNDGRQLVALEIIYAPDQLDTIGKYYLILEKPPVVQLKLNQTFLLQSAWHKEGDSIVNIGAGTVRSMSDTSAEVVGTILPGKKIQQGDMALFLVPLAAPGKDSLFFKMARLGIMFRTLGDSIFYERNSMLKAPETFPTQKLLESMAKDIKFTGDHMTTNYINQDRDITYGTYKDQKLFAMMQKTTSADVLEFLRYVYAKPDKYKAHTWKISETFATWVINGAPKVIK